MDSSLHYKHRVILPKSWHKQCSVIGIMDWLRDNVLGEWNFQVSRSDDEGPRILFQLSEDLVLFKLTFGF